MGHPYGLLLGGAQGSSQDVPSPILTLMSSSLLSGGGEQILQLTLASKLLISTYSAERILDPSSNSVSRLMGRPNTMSDNALSEASSNILDPIAESTSGPIFDKSTEREFSAFMSVNLSLLSWSTLDKKSPGIISQPPNPSSVFFGGGLVKNSKESPGKKGTIIFGKNSLSFGAAKIKFGRNRKQEQYSIKNGNGATVAKINPQDNLGFIHLASESGELKKQPPITRIGTMIQDLKQLILFIDSSDLRLFSKGEQQKILSEAKQTTLIGISHLVRLFRRQTGLPTWKLDVLPPLLQRFHAYDSQMVSNRFGGTRKVRPEDVEMMVITPQMRRELVARFSEAK